MPEGAQPFRFIAADSALFESYPKTDKFRVLKEEDKLLYKGPTFSPQGLAKAVGILPHIFHNSAFDVYALQITKRNIFLVVLAVFFSVVFRLPCDAETTPQNLRVVNYSTGWVPSQNGYQPALFLRLENKSGKLIAQNSVRMQVIFFDPTLNDRSVSKIIIAEDLRPKQCISLEAKSSHDARKIHGQVQCKILIRVGNVGDDKTELLLVTNVIPALREPAEAMKAIQSGEADQSRILNDIQKSFVRHPDMELNNDAVNLLRAGKYDEAKTALLRAISINPNYRLAIENLSICFNNSGIRNLKTKPDLALQEFRISMYLAPSDSARANINRLLFDTGKQPGDRALRLHMAEELVAKKDFASAIAEYEEALRLKDDSEIQAKIASLPSPQLLPDVRGKRPLYPKISMTSSKPPGSGNPQLQIWHSYMRSGIQNINENNIASANMQFTKAMDIVPHSDSSLLASRTSDEDRMFAESEAAQAFALRLLGRSADASVAFSDAISLLRKIKEAEAPMAGLLLCDAGVTKVLEGNVAEARPLLLDSVNVLERFRSVFALNLSTALTSLAGASDKYEAIGESSKAQLERLLQLGSDHPDVVSAFPPVVLGKERLEKWIDQSRTDLAQIEKASVGLTPDATLASAIENYASALFASGDSSKSEDLFGKALEIREKISGSNRIDNLNSLSKLAACKIAQGKANEAVKIYEKCIDISQSPDNGFNLYPMALKPFFLLGIAKSFEIAGDISKAEEAYKSALEMREKYLWPHHPDVALSQHVLGAFYARKGDKDQAISWIERSRKIRAEVFGEAFSRRLTPVAEAFTYLQSLGLKSDKSTVENLSTIVILLDSSAQMQEKIEGRSKMETAKQLIFQLLKRIPYNIKVSVRVFGHKVTMSSDDCTQTELVSSLDAENRSSLISSLDRISPTGKAGMANAVDFAVNDLKGRTGLKRVILITGGADSCDKNPSSAIQKAIMREPNTGLIVLSVAGNDRRLSDLHRKIAEDVGAPIFRPSNLDQLLENLLDAGKTDPSR